MAAEKSQHSSIEIIIHDPPSYHSVIETQPPPPSYIQSTIRLYYKNQPYISDLDQYNYQQQQERSNRLSYCSSKSWLGYMLAWATTLYDGRFICLTLFVLISIVVLGLIISFITIPNLIRHHP